MGLDLRHLPSEAAASLPDRLREAGFDVEVAIKPLLTWAEIRGRMREDGLDDLLAGLEENPILDRAERREMVLRCRRGNDVQTLQWVDYPDHRGEREVYIGNAWGWRGSVRRRREILQKDVTAIIEQNGGYWPCPD